MINRKGFLPLLSFLLMTSITGVAAAQVANMNQPQQSPRQQTVAQTRVSPARSRNLTPLLSKIWRVASAPSQPANGSIYIFLANGTLLQTSCVETYRIGTWTINKAQPDVLRVVEDGQLAYTAKITELTNTTLRLEKTLVRSNERQNLTLTAVEREFVCPDLPK
jgi:hypothetical protein